MPVDRTNGSVIKNMVLYVLPYLFSYFLQTLYGMADLYIIGQFNSTVEITAVSIGSQIMHMVTVMIVGLAMGTTVIVGQSLGAKDNRKISAVTGNSFNLFLILSFVAVAVLFVLTDSIVGLFSTPKECICSTGKNWDSRSIEGWIHPDCLYSDYSHSEQAWISGCGCSRVCWKNNMLHISGSVIDAFCSVGIGCPKFRGWKIRKFDNLFCSVFGFEGEFMAIQIFGTAKSFDVKKAERYFAERRIPVQKIDLKEKGISKGELESVIVCISKKTGGRKDAIELLADKKNKEYSSFAYLDDSDKEEKLLENPMLLVQPIVRNGKDAATVGYDPETWKTWN